MINLERLRNDLFALGLLAAAVLAALSLISYDPLDPPTALVYPSRHVTTNLCGPVGAHAAHWLRTAFGLASYVLLAAIILVDIRLFASGRFENPLLRTTGWLMSLAAACVGLQLLAPGLGSGPVVGSGGYLGAGGLALLDRHLSTAGTLILCSSTFVAGMLLTNEAVLFRMVGFVALSPWRLLRWILFGRSVASRDLQTDDDVAMPFPSDQFVQETGQPRKEPEASPEPVAAEPSARAVARRPFKVNPPVTARSDRARLMARLDRRSAGGGAGYELPDCSLLEQAEEFPYDLLAKNAQLAAHTLEKTFAEFGLNIRVSEIDTGPVVTQYELELEPGLRLNKVTALADDLAIALRVPSVRVVAPIPGKNTVGVEVPNEKQVMVRLRELIESCAGAFDKKRLPLFLGKDVSGHPLTVDLTRMPHLLIAGRTGTGKSVCLNSLILSLLMTRSPEDVKMLMIDPKMVELSPYKRVPHLMHPVITDMKKAEAVLAWAVDKMEERYDLLARCGVRHLDGYNKLGREKALGRLGIDPEDEEAEQIPERMPYIIIIADEMADMMMVSGKDVEGHIIRLAQKSRAVGIHLVLATQKPTVDVITGLIKSNLPARISFQVASRTDSRVVLDEMGAERLLGNGDMLYLAPGTSNLTRAQGTYVSDEEINNVIDFFGDEEPQYSTELAQVTAASSSKSGPDADRLQDELYEQAIEVVVREGRGSVSLLQRNLGIGYGRAARLIDYMAEDGIVGDYNGSQAREVLYTPEEWEAMRAGQEPALQEAAV